MLPNLMSVINRSNIIKMEGLDHPPGGVHGSPAAQLLRYLHLLARMTLATEGKLAGRL